MKQLRKLSILLTTTLLTITPISAKEFTGSDGWSVSFDGDAMNSNFKSSSITESISSMQPGDTVNFEVSLSNNYSQTTSWYMSNEVLQTLEDTQTVAEGGAYSYTLTYIDSTGKSELLYSNDSDTIGGSANTQDGKAYIITSDESYEGLTQATTSLKDYFYLDDVGSKESGKVTLKVHLEGETQGNDYQDTMAKLQLNFAVELTKSTTKKVHKSVDTSDTSNILMYSIIALVAGLACVGLVVYNVKSRKEEQ